MNKILCKVLCAKERATHGMYRFVSITDAENETKYEVMFKDGEVIFSNLLRQF